MPAGAPTKYDPSMCETVTTLMTEGASKVEVCAELGISYETFLQWQDPEGDYYKEEFSESVKRGNKLSEAWWLKKGRVNLENTKFSATLWYMNMKNRHGWKDKTDITSNDKPLDNKWVIEVVNAKAPDTE